MAKVSLRSPRRFVFTYLLTDSLCHGL